MSTPAVDPHTLPFGSSPQALITLGLGFGKGLLAGSTISACVAGEADLSRMVAAPTTTAISVRLQMVMSGLLTEKWIRFERILSQGSPACNVNDRFALRRSNPEDFEVCCKVGLTSTGFRSRFSSESVVNRRNTQQPMCQLDRPRPMRTEPSRRRSLPSGSRQPRVGGRAE